ncbi:MAG: class I SAM-dependent methyltransferase [bacterium]
MRRPIWLNDDKEWGLPRISKIQELRDSFSSFCSAINHLYKNFFSRIALHRLTKKGELCISLGSGKSVPIGWIGIDIYNRGTNVFYGDLRRPLNLPNQSVKAILAEHSLEHLFLDDVSRLLNECYRVLQSRGVIRIVSPDARFLIRIINNPADIEVQEQILYDQEIHRTEITPISHWIVANRISHQWGDHKSLLSAPLLIDLLCKAGFSNIVELKSDHTAYFEKIPGTHYERFPGPDYESFAVEACRI